jgi:hypothetical protein
MSNYLENNSTQCLLSPRRERIEVRGDMIRTSTPTLTFTPSKGEGIGGNQFSWFVSGLTAMGNYLENNVTVPAR